MAGYFNINRETELETEQFEYAEVYSQFQKQVEKIRLWSENMINKMPFSREKQKKTVSFPIGAAGNDAMAPTYI